MRISSKLILLTLVITSAITFLHADSLKEIAAALDMDASYFTAQGYIKYKCPYCKYQFSPRQQRLNCPNCAREIILWDLLNRV